MRVIHFSSHFLRSGISDSRSFGCCVSYSRSPFVRSASPSNALSTRAPYFFFSAEHIRTFTLITSTPFSGQVAEEEKIYGSHFLWNSWIKTFEENFLDFKARSPSRVEKYFQNLRGLFRNRRSIMLDSSIKRNKFNRRDKTGSLNSQWMQASYATNRPRQQLCWGQGLKIGPAYSRRKRRLLW